MINQSIRNISTPWHGGHLVYLNLRPMFYSGGSQHLVVGNQGNRKIYNS